MTSNEENKYKYMVLLQHYGIDNQMNIAQEECAELIQAISKYKRSQHNIKLEKKSLSHIAEEIADVQIMINQLIMYFCLQNDVKKNINYKLKRQLDRINKEKEAKDYEI